MKLYEKYLKSLNESVYGIASVTPSLTDPPRDIAVRSALSVAGDDSDTDKKVKRISDMVADGDIENAAKLAAKYAFRYGKGFSASLDSAIDNKEFKSLYAKEKQSLKSGEKDKPKELPKKKDEPVNEADNSSDKEKINDSLGKIKEKVSRIMDALRSGKMVSAAKAVVEYTDLWGAPFTEALQTAMLAIKDKEFLESWKLELAKQQKIWKELHPTTPPPPPKKKEKKKEPPPDKPKPPAHVGSKKPVGPEGSK